MEIIKAVMEVLKMERNITDRFEAVENKILGLLR
jgi:hypothetical protein